MSVLSWIDEVLRILQTNAPAGAAPVSTQSNGWSSAFTGDRPKSATNVAGGGSGVMAPSGGMMSSLTGSRPSSSTQPVPSSSTAGSGSGQWGAPSGGNPGNNGGGMGVASSNTNSLSYGSLKNRFLSGTTKTATPTGAAAAGTNGAAAPSAAANSGKSKLFSLAR